jgi:hypothetical protein
MQQLQFIGISISSTCFGKFFAHPRERKAVFYSVWYNAPKLLPAGGLQRGGTTYVFGLRDVARLEQQPSHRTHPSCDSKVLRRVVLKEYCSLHLAADTVTT